MMKKMRGGIHQKAKCSDKVALDARIRCSSRSCFMMDIRGMSYIMKSWSEKYSLLVAGPYLLAATFNLSPVHSGASSVTLHRGKGRRGECRSVTMRLRSWHLVPRTQVL